MRLSHLIKLKKQARCKLNVVAVVVVVAAAVVVVSDIVVVDDLVGSCRIVTLWIQVPCAQESRGR